MYTTANEKKIKIKPDGAHFGEFKDSFVTM